jgi:Tfp pilus assembly protein PilF
MTSGMNPSCRSQAERRGAQRTACRVSLLCLLLALAGCANKPVPAQAPGGLAELMERPGERALVEAIRAYDDGQYAQAESALRKALSVGLASGRDRATANKLLAFITCSSQRLMECENAFRTARVADPGFALSRSEAGHPLWGPVYRRVTQ